jgi:GDP-L-fucose synthase
MTIDFWQSKKVIVTGGAGFLGSFVVEKLKQQGCQNICIPLIEEFDLRKEKDIIKLYQGFKADLVIHLAAAVGGIGANQANPGSFFYDNLIMGIQLIEQARQHNIPKFVAIGTVCAYPKFAPVPFREEDIWNGYPEETNAPYGLAKKMLLVQSQAYRQQYGYNSIFLLPLNLYGPRDNFNPGSSHVIPAIIKKCVDAVRTGKNSIELWGTGNASRGFLYVEDAAEGIILAAGKYDKSDPVNLGTEQEIKIRELAELIAQLTSFKGNIVWDNTKPDGQPRRGLDTSKARSEFGFLAKTNFKDGLKKTIDWYLAQYPAKQ